MYGECGADGSVYADSPEEAIEKTAKAFGRTFSYIERRYEPFGTKAKTTIPERQSLLKESIYYNT